MSIIKKLRAAFPVVCQSGITDAFIVEHPDLMWLNEPIDLMSLVPSYMFWCVENPDWSSSVPGYTVNALAEFGRSADPEIQHLNFRFHCSTEQQEAVIAFLKWCESENPLLNESQIHRAIARWQNAANNSLQGRRP